MDNRITRRNFVKDVSMGVAAFYLFGCSPKKSPFDNTQRDCVISMAEQIVPRDDFAGATDANVICYIENWYTIYYPEKLEAFKNRIDAVERVAMKMHSKLFQDLDFDTQFDFMKQMESGKLDDKLFGVNQRAFFNEILDRTMQGFYGNPRHGGNKDFVSYRMMNLDMPIVIGQNRYKI